jgi:cell division protein FtsQ
MSSWNRRSNLSETSTLRPFRALWFVTLLVGLAAIGAAGWGATRTPLFEMRALHVTGNRHLTDAEVARLAGLSRSTNVLWLRGSAIAHRIERDPWILRARVTRSLPGTVTVSIQERRPVAIIESGRSLLLVSGDGVVLGQAPASARLPVIHAPGAPLAVGARLSAVPAELVIARSLPPAVRGKVQRITTLNHGALTLLLRSGVQVLYGDASEAGSKGRALASLLSWAKREGIRADRIDLRAPAAPALIPVGAVVPAS